MNLPQRTADAGFDRPCLVAEWGAIGHWDVEITAWRAPIEQNGAAKADNYLKSHEMARADNPRLLGAYAFPYTRDEAGGGDHANVPFPVE